MTAIARMKDESMTHFRFGGLTLDAAEFGSQGSAVLGIRDSGKSYTATALAEKLHESGVPFIAYDPIGVWRFLRVPGDHKGGRGFPIVVAGGVAGDLPLTPATAPAIVEAAMREGVSLVIDLFHIDLSKADWRRIVRDTVRLLLHKNKPHGLRHVFIEEAAEFAPQKVLDGDVYAEIEKLARMGGNSRLGYTLINQRAEEVNKAVLELCDNLFLHRQKGRNSLTALGKWLDVGGVKQGKALTESLPMMPQGECWAWLSGSDTPLHIKVPRKHSLHPDRRTMRGDEDAAPGKGAIDVGRFVAAMQSALPKLAAEADASDPKKLNAEIARLRRELAAAQKHPAAAPAPKIDVDTIREKAWEDGHGAGYTQGHTDGREEGFADAIERTRAALEGVQQKLPPPKAPPKVIAPAQPKLAPPARHAPPPRAAPTQAPDGVSGPTLRLLEGLAFWESIGIDTPSRQQLAPVADYSPRSSGFEKALSIAKTTGLIDYPGPGLVRRTDAGAAIDVRIPGGSVRDKLGPILGPTYCRLIDALPQDGVPMSRSDLADATDYSGKSSGFEKALSSLKTLGLIVYPQPGYVAVEEWVWS